MAENEFDTYTFNNIDDLIEYMRLLRIQLNLLDVSFIAIRLVHPANELDVIKAYQIKIKEYDKALLNDYAKKGYVILKKEETEN